MIQTCKFCAHVLTICFVFNRLLIVDGRLSTRPTNTETVQGHSIRLNCSTNEPYFVNWQHTPYGAKQREFVYFGGEVVAPYHHRFKVIHDQESGRYDLVIEPIQLEDAGTYRCTDSEGMGESEKAELIVLKSPPNCTCEQCSSEGRACYASTNRNQSSVSCSLSFWGNIAPTLSCPYEVQSNSTETGSEGGTTVEYVLQYREDTRLLSQGNRCHTSLSNIPSNAFESIVTHKSYEMSRTIINQSDELICELRTERVCEYKWIRVDKNNKTVSTNRSCYIAEPGIYRCEADCSESGSPCIVQPMEVELTAKVETSGDYSVSAITYVTVAMIFGITCILTIVAIVTYKRLKGRNKKEKFEDGLMENRRELLANC